MTDMLTNSQAEMAALLDEDALAAQPFSCSRLGCGPDLPCESCVIDWLVSRNEWEAESRKPIWRNVNRVPVDEIVTDRQQGAGTGSGSRSLGRGFRPATDKQVAYLTHLAAELGTLDQLSVDGLSSSEASDLIDLARAELDRRPAPAADGPIVGRWRKHDGSWAIHAPGADEGQTIIVRRSTGEEREVILGDNVGPNLFVEDKAAAKAERRAERRAPHQPSIEVEEGRPYWSADRELVVMIARSRETDNLYGKVWDGHSFRYQPGALRLAAIPMTLDEAAAFGKETGRCCCCARKLTNPESIAAGIGPICAGRL